MLIVKTLALLFSGLNLVVTGSGATSNKTQSYYDVTYTINYSRLDFLVDYLDDDQVQSFDFLSFSCTGVDHNLDTGVETAITYSDFPKFRFIKYATSGQDPMYQIDILSYYRISNVNFYGYVQTDSDTMSFSTLNAGDDVNILNFEIDSDDIYNSSSLYIEIKFIAGDYTQLINLDSDYYTGYSAGYDSGYKDGYDTGFNDGKLVGFDDGVASVDTTAIRNTGYQEGYVAGQASVTADYGFMSLFASIADTPILMMRKLFDFSIFGTSMLALVLSLLTAIILIHVIKKVIK